MALNLEMTRGSTKKWAFDVFVDGAPFNTLPNTTVYFSAKYEYEDPDSKAVFIKSSPANGIQLTGGSNRAIVKLEDTDTRTLPAEELTLQVELELIDATGDPYEIDRGTLKVHPDVRIGA